MSLAQQLKALQAALSLLTRLVPPPRDTTADTLIKAVPWYPFAGLAVGLCATLPLALGLASSHPTIQAWLYLLVALFCTRCLHWDGLADVADAWGSGTRGERFQAILKDSRLGAFGGIALVFVALGCLVTLAPLCAAKRFDILIIAPIIGRIAALMLAVLTPGHPDSSLGRLLSQGASRRLACLYSLVALALLTLCAPSSLALVACLITLACLTTALARLADREGGLSGDYFGSAIVLAELAVFTCFVD